MRKARYELMKVFLTRLLNDLSILAGEKSGAHPSPVGPSFRRDVTWREVAGTAMVHAQALADQLKAAHLGYHEPRIMFPSPSECLKEDNNKDSVNREAK